MEKQLKHISKFISLVLRHKPDEIGLEMDEQGWVTVEELIRKMNQKGFVIDKDILNTIVETNDKKRFAFNADKSLIRANQGHSIEVDLDLQSLTPPDVLYHGTTDRFLDSILKTGLQKQKRQHVHLSATIETARTVGSRHGKPVILTIDTRAMHDAGFKFYLSENKVWLTEAVPVEFISQ